LFVVVKLFYIRACQLFDMCKRSYNYWFC